MEQEMEQVEQETERWTEQEAEQQVEHQAGFLLMHGSEREMSAVEGPYCVRIAVCADVPFSVIVCETYAVYSHKTLLNVLSGPDLEL